MSEALTLSQLNERVKAAITAGFSQAVWIRAEISEIRKNTNGHYYLELIEKDEKSDRIVAKNKATIWSFTSRMLIPYFETSTGQSLHAGLRILICCSVEYHELYGVSLNISDIDPTYTIGEIALRRQQILLQLQEEGIADMNRELPFPRLPQRIAIISSGTAAGYGDFCDQLLNNSNGYIFYPHLFQATMQGDKSEQSLIDALDAIYTHAELFDIVIIIRGGGATADLHHFDRYTLAAHCAQFPIPILTGIGHQRDTTILDEIAHKSLKTPTAVAEYLVSKMEESEKLVIQFSDRFSETIALRLEDKNEQLHEITVQIPHLLIGRTEDKKIELERYRMQLIQNSHVIQNTLKQQLLHLPQTFKHLTKQYIRNNKQVIDQRELQLAYTNPLSLLQRGYSLTYKNGKRVTSTKVLQPGDHITTLLADGTTESVVVSEKN